MTICSRNVEIDHSPTTGAIYLDLFRLQVILQTICWSFIAEISCDPSNGPRDYTSGSQSNRKSTHQRRVTCHTTTTVVWWHGNWKWHDIYLDKDKMIECVINLSVHFQLSDCRALLPATYLMRSAGWECIITSGEIYTVAAVFLSVMVQ